MKRNIILFSIALLSIFKTFAQPCKEVVGYYASWQWYDRKVDLQNDRDGLVNPTTIRYDKYSILNYAFIRPKADGSLTLTDSWGDKNLLLGPINWSVEQPLYYANSKDPLSYGDMGIVAYHKPGMKFSDYCHAKGVKMLVSIGGWEDSKFFPSISADATKRAKFVQSCLDLIPLYGLDGIDIDWEYPGIKTPTHNGTPQDKANFTILLQDLRTALNNYGTAHNKQLLLTIAVGASQTHMTHVDWAAITPLVDIINVMSYDFFGAWDATTNHNAPLFASATGDPTFNCSQGIEKLVDDYKVPASKLTMGFGFYGRSVKTKNAPNLHVETMIDQADKITFDVDSGVPTYYNILKNKYLFDEKWDPSACVPYLLGRDGLKTFVGYDNERSIGMKAKYIVDHNLRGGIIWEMSGDYIQSTANPRQVAGTPLLDTLNKVFCKYPGGGKFDPYITWANPSDILVGTPLTANQLNAFANVPGTYSYSPALSTVLPAGTHTLTVMFTPAKSAFYTTQTATVTIKVTTNNGISELAASGFTMYPNPSNTILNFSKDLHEIEVINVFGQTVIPTIEATNHINVGSLAEGMYYLKSVEGQYKFMVKH